MAKTVTQKVFNELKNAYLAVSNNLVGVDHHVDKIMEKIGAHISETRIVGIHGMGGVGKTTIAKIIYNELSNKYKNCCFLYNIHETSKLKDICYLQQQLISDILKMERTHIRNIYEGIEIIGKRFSDKKVLLLLDDVEEKVHMDALVGKRDWFGEGSKVIVTTRRKDVLCVPEVDWRYELTCLDPNQSLQLFSKHAFKRDSPIDEYINQSKRVVHIAGGLPLALEVIGSLLFITNKEMWDAILKKLESVPNDKVQSNLKISYDALNEREQHIFLDIACHFIGYHKDIVVYFWDALGHFSEETLEVLQNMSLIKNGIDNKLWMHDQLRDIGREIVRQESKMEIEKQRRVWNPKDGLDLLKRHEEKKEVKALHLKFDDQHNFTYKDFKRLPNLTFLEVDNSQENFRAKRKLFWLKWPSYALPTNIFQRNSDLLPQLRWLSWHNIHPTFKIANFSVEKLIILDLSWSEITHDWKGWSHVKVTKNLKVLNLAHCRRLNRTPNFLAHSNLKHLILSGCVSLIEIDRSICQLKSLVFLDVSNCQRLKKTPSFSAHSNLEHLILSGCKSLIEIDRSICQLKSLVFLDVSNCWNLQRLPEMVGNSLAKLDISHTSIEEVPNFIGMLKNLKVMKMHNSVENKDDACWKGMEIIHSYNCATHVHTISGYFIYGVSMYTLGWPRVHALPRFSESLIELELEQLRVDTFPDLSYLANLKVLHLGFGPPNRDGKSNGLLEKQIPRWIGNLSKLESLVLVFLEKTASSTDLSLPPDPPLPSSLSVLRLSGCGSLCSMDLSNLRKLSDLNICCSAVAKIEGLGCLENLRELRLEYLGQLVMLPDLSKLNRLRSILVTHCGNLVEIQGELLRFLDKLKIELCNSLQEFPDLFSLMRKTDVDVHIRNQTFEYRGGHRLLLRGFEQMQIPDLSNLDKIKHLIVRDCHNLVEIQGELPQSLETLCILCCESLQKLPELSSLKRPREVIIRGCGKLDSLQEFPDMFSLMRKTDAFVDIPNQTFEYRDGDVYVDIPNQTFEYRDGHQLLLRGFKQMPIPDLSNLDRITHLIVEYCHNQVEIQGELPQSLETLYIDSCESLQKLTALPQSLETLYIDYCISLQKLPELSSLKRLREVTFSRLYRLMQIPDLSNWNRLTVLEVRDCHNLVEIQGELPQSLEELYIDSCESLQKLPELSSLKGLRKVAIRCCGKLAVEEISRLCSEKSIKFVGEDNEEDKLPVWARILRYVRGRWARR